MNNLNLIMMIDKGLKEVKWIKTHNLLYLKICTLDFPK